MKAKKKPLAPPRSPLYIAATGSLAQLVERFVYTEDVGSSSLSRPTIHHNPIVNLTQPAVACARTLLCGVDLSQG